MRKETEGEVELKLSFSLQLLIYHCSWTNYFFADGEIVTNNATTWDNFSRHFLIEMRCWMHVREKKRDGERGRSRSVSFN